MGSKFVCMYLSTSIRNTLLVLLSSLSSTSSLSMTLSSSISMDASIGIVIGIGIIYLEAGPSGRTMPKRPHSKIDIYIGSISEVGRSSRCLPDFSRRYIKLKDIR
jgi:hypothetical protein